jgi:hypothetical protein
MKGRIIFMLDFLQERSRNTLGNRISEYASPEHPRQSTMIAIEAPPDKAAPVDALP